jgi:DNA-binding NtrC family response regulator
LLVNSAENTTGENVAFQKSCESGNRRRTILLVEDEPFVREATGNILEHASFAVLKTADANEAMRVYEERAGDIDLLLTDMVLPGASGEQLGQNLHQHSPGLVVLITSGYNNVEFDTDKPESLTYFLMKPYSRRTLLEKIEKITTPLPLARPA